MKKKLRIVICGTNYGKFYLSAFLKERSDFELAGILANGSARSCVLAQELKVPLYTKTEQVPANIDICCVAVRSTILGGAGTRIAIDLLKRGINVIQEHPVHFMDLRECFQLSRLNGGHYHVNSHFVHVQAVKTFIDYVQKYLAHNRPLFIDITTALPYSALDIVGQALGALRPFAFEPSPVWENELATKIGSGLQPYKCIQGVIAGVPVVIRMQNYYDPDDAVHNYLVMHRICIGSESGNVTLVSPHGPVIWSQGYPQAGEEKGSPECDADNTVMSRHLQAGRRAGVSPTSVQFTTGDAPSFSKIVGEQWPDGIVSALKGMKSAIESGLDPLFQSETYLKDLAEMWIGLMKQSGKPLVVPTVWHGKPLPDPLEYRESLNVGGISRSEKR